MSEAQSNDLSKLPIETLYNMRRHIDKFLPQQSLKSVNMERELVVQLAIVKKLQKDSLNNDEGTPVNQLAQVANSVASALATLAKLQTEVYTSERLKILESVMIDCLKTLPQEAQKAFLDEYERRLGA